MKVYGGEDKEFVFYKGSKFFISNNTYDIIQVNDREQGHLGRPLAE